MYKLNSVFLQSANQLQPLLGFEQAGNWICGIEFLLFCHNFADSVIDEIMFENRMRFFDTETSFNFDILEKQAAKCTKKQFTICIHLQK